MTKIFSLLVLAVGLSACEKETDPVIVPEVVKPMVKLITPTIHQHYHPGTVIISGEASAGAMLHGYDLMVFDRKTGDTLFKDNDHAHGLSFTFSDTMVHGLLADYDARAYVKVYIDHDHNYIADSVDFYLLAQ
jgi:hypothetical protein